MRTWLVAVCLASGCRDAAPARDKPAPPVEKPQLTGACLEPEQNDCWEHPAGGDPEILADICDNQPGAKWIGMCPREGMVGGCKSPNKYDRRAPTRWFYTGSVELVKARCAADGDMFVDVKTARLVP